MNMWPILFSIIGAIGVLCLLYGFFIEPKFIRQRHVTVTLPAPRVTHLTKPLKVVFFSDIHIGPRTTKDKLDRQMRAIMRNKPMLSYSRRSHEEATPPLMKLFNQ